MGMYTEAVIKADLLDDLPPDVMNIFLFLFGDNESEPTEIPDHAFFKCVRWKHLGKMSSYYHHPKAFSNIEDTYIFSRSDLKNYDNEIELFFDWSEPYWNEPKGKCLGWSWYEEADAPTLIFKRS